jgi:hypothetical protein
MKQEAESVIDVEQLLRDKSWEQLNADERNAAAEAFGDETGYERVRAMTDELRSGAGIEEEELKPQVQVRENLLAAFDDEQRRRRVLWWNSLGFWLRDKLRLDIPVVRFAVAGVILVLGIFTVMQVTTNEIPERNIAGNHPVPPIPAEDNYDKKLDDNIEPPGMNVQPLTWPYIVFNPQPFPLPEEKQHVVAEEIIPQENHDTIVDPQLENMIAMTDTVANANAGFAMADSIAVSPLTLSFTNATGAICCGASNENVVTLTGASPAYSYNWTSPSNASVTFNATNSNMVTVYSVVPNCRSLANDSKVIAAMFSMR